MPLGQGAASASAHTCAARMVSISQSRAFSALLTWASQTVSGAPRKQLCSPGGGPPAVSIRYRAARKPARSAAKAARSAGRAVAAGSPGSHR